MAKGKRSTIKRNPRVSGAASDCLIIKVDDDGNEHVTGYMPKPARKPRRVSVVTLPNGELIVRHTDL